MQSFEHLRIKCFALGHVKSSRAKNQIFVFMFLDTGLFFADKQRIWGIFKCLGQNQSFGSRVEAVDPVTESKSEQKYAWGSWSEIW